MKKFLFLAIIAASLMACGSKNNQNTEVASATASDSAFLVNDSTIGNLQNFTYQGIIPAEGSPGTAYTITLQQVTGDSIGTYTMTMEPIDPKTGKVDAVRDSGVVVTVIGNPQTDGAIIYQLISATPENGKTNFALAGDSLTKVDKDMKPEKKAPVVLKKVMK